MWDLPGPGLEPVSPALAGGFLTTVPPGKPLKVNVLLLCGVFFTAFLWFPFNSSMTSHEQVAGEVPMHQHEEAGFHPGSPAELRQRPPSQDAGSCTRGLLLLSSGSGRCYQAQA